MIQNVQVLYTIVGERLNEKRQQNKDTYNNIDNSNNNGDIKYNNIQ